MWGSQEEKEAIWEQIGSLKNRLDLAEAAQKATALNTAKMVSRFLIALAFDSYAVVSDILSGLMGLPHVSPTFRAFMEPRRTQALEDILKVNSEPEAMQIVRSFRESCVDLLNSLVPPAKK